MTNGGRADKDPVLSPRPQHSLPSDLEKARACSLLPNTFLIDRTPSGCRGSCPGTFYEEEGGPERWLSPGVCGVLDSEGSPGRPQPYVQSHFTPRSTCFRSRTVLTEELVTSSLTKPDGKESVFPRAARWLGAAGEPGSGAQGASSCRLIWATLILSTCVP